ncbi:Ig-like domain-containing protein [Paenibacillus sp. GCM10023252]|uniref:Ig-like domain-containing protein n=1 Tax=Paenibacillus sp. GCM10023252 TaxID=3252649 RepID=UPI0036187C6E
MLLCAVLLFTGIPSVWVSAADLTTEQKYSFLVQRGIFTGYADGSSRLHESMTREQFAAVLFRLFKLQEWRGSASFNDVKAARWSYGEIGAIARADLMEGVGNGRFSPTAEVSVEQLAVVLVRAYKASGSTSSQVYGKVSSWAKKDVGIALGKGWIPEQMDYKVDALRSLLVVAAYEVYRDMNPDYEPLDIVSVKAISSTAIQIDLRKAVQSVSMDQFKLQDAGAKSVRLLSAKLSNQNKTITITTDKQTSNAVYFLSINGNVTWTYVSYSKDESKPVISSYRILADARVELVFSEAILQNTAENRANYRFDRNLGVKSATLSSDKKTVWIVTDKQTSGQVYTLTVRNIQDLAGNTMDARSNLYFGAVVDKTAPAVTGMTVTANKVVLVFSEKLDFGSAEWEGHYVIDGGIGNPSRAIYNDNDKTVTLTIGNLAGGRLYTLTINGVKDAAGNSIAANTSRSLTGSGTNTSTPYQLQGIGVVNQNTVDVVFSRVLTDMDISRIRLNLISDNQASVNTSGIGQYVSAKPGDDKAVRIQLRSSSEGNPVFFREGHVYLASITGLPGLNTANQANEKRFAGLNEPNRQPYVTKASADNRTSVTVQFSEPVKNVHSAAFKLTDSDGNAVSIASDQLGDRSKVVTQVTLNLNAPLTGSKSYRLSFNRGITDAAGWNEWTITEGNEPYRVSFQGTDQLNAAPKLKSVSAIDRYTFMVSFTEPVRGADQEVYSLNNETDRTGVRLTKGSYANYERSDDRMSVIIRLQADTSGPLRSGKTYKLTYGGDGAQITDDQGARLQTDGGAGELRFQGTDADNERPRILTAEAWSSLLILTLSEPVQGMSGQTNLFTLTAGGSALSATSASYRGKTILLHLNSKPAGTVLAVKFSSQGELDIRDKNGQRPLVQTIQTAVR